MNALKLLLFLLIGTAAMLVPINIQGSRYQLDGKKKTAIAVLLTLVGTIGTFLLFYIENQRFGGISFFGAVFFIPIAFVPIAYILDISFSRLMDLCAPAECAMLVVMKVQCALTGCCGGRLVSAFGESFIFPSQIVELIVAICICVTLLCLSRKKAFWGIIHPLYLIIYGASRFILNSFRNVKMLPVINMALGHVWSLLAIIIGSVWLLICWMRKKRISTKDCDE